MFKKIEDLELELEKLLDEPFMSITNPPPKYVIEHQSGPEGYGQTIVSLELKNINKETISAFHANYEFLGSKFEEWANSKGFIDSQILSGENNTLTFEITTILPD